MAQIVTITNPLTGQPAQVDQLEHTAQEIDDAIARALPDGAIDTLLAGKAPAGYGLGESVGKTINTLDEIDGFGFYRIPTDSGVAPDTSTNWGAIFIGSNINYGTLIASREGGLIATRTKIGVWADSWEWVNPPMLLGVEYRTTERYQGKPVYVKAIDLGALPNATSKTVEWGSNNVQPIRYSGRTETVGRFAFPYASYIQCAVSGNKIIVYTTANYSAYTASLVVYYTKTTD